MYRLVSYEPRFHYIIIFSTKIKDKVPNGVRNCATKAGNGIVFLVTNSQWKNWNKVGRR